MGAFGRQTPAPKSIRPCAKSPERFSGQIASALSLISAFAFGSGVSIAKSRETTRSILPSTTTARRPNAIAATAAAV